MGRRPCCEKVGLKKGPWTADEDKKLIDFMLNNAQCSWRALPKFAGLLRCGKSCRLRWTNYLRPDLKRGLLSEDEEKTVIDLHAQLGNRWAKISSHLPGRTDNEIKNYWNTYIKKKLRKMGIDPVTHKPLQPPTADEDPRQEVAAEQSITVVPAAEPTSLQQSTNLETSEYNNSNNNGDKVKIDSSELLLVNNADFCIDEIPVIEPHEILLSSNENEKNSPVASSSSSSSNSYTCDVDSWMSDGLEDILNFSPSFEVYYNEILKWDSELGLLLDYDTEMSKNNAQVVEESEKVDLL